MSYLTQSTISVDPTMIIRVTQCAACEAIHQPDAWARSNGPIWAAAPGWDAAWESALVAHKNDDDYQPGADETVITDIMILTQVQLMAPLSAPPIG